MFFTFPLFIFSSFSLMSSFSISSLSFFMFIWSRLELEWIEFLLSRHGPRWWRWEIERIKLLLTWHRSRWRWWKIELFLSKHRSIRFVEWSSPRNIMFIMSHKWINFLISILHSLHIIKFLNRLFRNKLFSSK